MRILFDQGTPAPLRDYLSRHDVATAYELGWATLRNGELLSRCEGRFDVMVTTDRNLRHQQSLAGRKLAIVVLPTTSWPRLKGAAERIAEFVTHVAPGTVAEFPGEDL